MPCDHLAQLPRRMWGIGARPARISPLEDYTQWKRALGDEAESDSGRFQLVEGFEIELVRAATEDDGSWVALAFDESGRLTIAREDRGLLRLLFDEPGGSIAKVETIDDELLECRGLVYVDGDLYANANNSKALYRLRDTDSDGDFDETTVIREFPGSVGHGRNQLAVHGGAIWSICGDAVDVPTDMIDRTSPFREARRGESTREGFLARFDMRSGEWELYCAGLRNPFGVAFNRDGEAFTYDADAEYDMGSPWYRPTRVVHLRSGADYGWRGVTKQWPPYDPDHPDNAQPLLDIGKGSPTAVDFGYDSSFPPVYRDALYILDWAYGRVLAVHMTPRGGTYRAQAETFLQGSPLNVTGIDFGPDGAMYLVTGGRSTKSALYRVSHVGDSVAESRRSEHLVDLDEHAANSRKLRLELEAFHTESDRTTDSNSTRHSGSRDPSIRSAAQTSVHHGIATFWPGRANHPDVSTMALVTLLGNIYGRAQARDVLVRLLPFQFAGLSTSDQLTLLHAVALCRQLDGELDGEFRDSLLEQFDTHFPVDPEFLRVSAFGTSVEVNRELARLLVDLKAPGIVDRCFSELQRSTAQEDRLHFLFLLRDVESGWTAETQQAYFSALREADQFVAGEGMPTFLDLIREAATERLSEADRGQLASLLQPAGVEVQSVAVDRPLVREWTLEGLTQAVAQAEHDPSAGTRTRDLQTGAVRALPSRWGAGAGRGTGSDVCWPQVQPGGHSAVDHAA